MNSEDFKCNTCGDYVGEEGVWGLCDPCFDKEGGNEALAKSMEWSWAEPTRTRPSDPRWEDELVTYLKDFCVAVKTDGYSVPFEFSTAKRAIVAQGGTVEQVQQCLSEVHRAVQIVMDEE